MQEGTEVLFTIRSPPDAQAASKNKPMAIGVSYDAFIDDITVINPEPLWKPAALQSPFIIFTSPPFYWFLVYFASCSHYPTADCSCLA